MGRLLERLQGRASFIDSLTVCDWRFMIHFHSVEADA